MQPKGIQPSNMHPSPMQAGSAAWRSLRVDPALRSELEGLYADYASALDERRYEDWLKFFTEDCKYKVQSRENHSRGLPLATLAFESRGRRDADFRRRLSLTAYQARSNFRICRKQTIALFEFSVCAQDIRHSFSDLRAFFLRLSEGIRKVNH